MIITDRFVYVHEPKTGGTFVTTVLLRLHDITFTKWTHLWTAIRPEVKWQGKLGELVYHNNKHGTCENTPPAYRGRPFLATVRNPFDLYVSEYEFGWWKRPSMRRYFHQIEDFTLRFPKFPELTFGEYVTASNLAFRSNPGAPDAGDGWLTNRFIRYYCRNPQAVMLRPSESRVDVESVRRALHDVTFLKTNQLNVALHEYLRSIGYPEADIAFILTLGRILPQGKGRTPGQSWQRYYTPAITHCVREREKVIFELFPEFAE